MFGLRPRTLKTEKVFSPLLLEVVGLVGILEGGTILGCTAFDEMPGDVAFAMVAVEAFASAGLMVVVNAFGWIGNDLFESLLSLGGDRMRVSGPLPPGVPSSGG